MYISAFPIGKHPNWKGDRDAFTSQKVELLINSLAHIAPTIKQKKYSPGLFSAILLFIPIGVVGYVSILNDDLMSLSEVVVSIIIGLFWMSVPFIYQAIRVTSEKRE